MVSKYVRVSNTTPEEKTQYACMPQCYQLKNYTKKEQSFETLPADMIMHAKRVRV